MKSRIRKILIGDNTFSAYSSITVPEPISEKVFLEIGGLRVDVSTTHWILCIKPLVIGVWLEFDPHMTRYGLSLCDGHVTLEYMAGITHQNGVLLLLKMSKSVIHQLDPIRRRLIWYRYFQQERRHEELSFGRFCHFVAAYSYPRRIRLISFRDEDYFNIFPMDLLGEVPGNRYVFGLRHTNIALARIIRTRKLAVSEVSYAYKDIVYQLGRHHSSAPPSKEALPFALRDTEHYGFPVPDFVYGTTEMRIVETMDLGSHMLLWGEKLPSRSVQDRAAGDGLYLVHFLHFLYQQNRRPYTLV